MNTRLLVRSLGANKPSALSFPIQELRIGNHALLSSDDTKIQRIADLTLSPEGDLDGTIRELFWATRPSPGAWIICIKTMPNAKPISRTPQASLPEFEVKDIKVSRLPRCQPPESVFRIISPSKGIASAPANASFCAPVSLPPVSRLLYRH